MARPREFDEAVVLDAAVNCFWQHGYQAASVRELAAEMGLTGPSLYNAFGDKRALFRAALDRYVRQWTRPRIAEVEAKGPPKAAIRTFVAGIIARALADTERRGCLLVNAALEIAPHDREIGADVAAFLEEIEGFYRRAITAAQADGSVPAERDAKDLARLFLGVTLAVRVLARSKPDRKLLEGLARPALALLDHAPPRGHS